MARTRRETDPASGEEIVCDAVVSSVSACTCVEPSGIVLSFAGRGGGGSLQGGEHERDSVVFRPVTPVAVVRAWLSPLVTPN